MCGVGPDLVLYDCLVDAEGEGKTIPRKPTTLQDLTRRNRAIKATIEPAASPADAARTAAARAAVSRRTDLADRTAG